MNDRFKFRCFYDDDKTMYYHNFWEIPNTSKEEVAHLMQCTGLKDKNGKLIYEGDIVEVFHVSSTMQGRKFKDLVYFEKKYPSFQLKENGFIQEDDLIEVIGNIYENEELLNEQLRKNKINEL